MFAIGKKLRPAMADFLHRSINLADRYRTPAEGGDAVDRRGNVAAEEDGIVCTPSPSAGFSLNVADWERWPAG
jgi:hypothetical protein